MFDKFHPLTQFFIWTACAFIMVRSMNTGSLPLWVSIPCFAADVYLMNRAWGLWQDLRAERIKK